MEIEPWQILFGSLLVVMLVALFGILFRQGQSPTHKQMHDLHQQLREELRAEIKEAVRTAAAEIIAEMNRQIAEVNRRIDETNQRIDETNQRIDETNQRIDRVLAALANHEHIDGRVMITVQPDTEPAPAADDD